MTLEFGSIPRTSRGKSPTLRACSKFYKKWKIWTIQWKAKKMNQILTTKSRSKPIPELTSQVSAWSPWWPRPCGLNNTHWMTTRLSLLSLGNSRVTCLLSSTRKERRWPSATANGATPKTSWGPSASATEWSIATTTAWKKMGSSIYPSARQWRTTSFRWKTTGEWMKIRLKVL